LDDAAVMQAVAIGYLAAMGTALCTAELRARTGALMRGELLEDDVYRTVNDLDRPPALEANCVRGIGRLGLGELVAVGGCHLLDESLPGEALAVVHVALGAVDCLGVPVGV
jgi:hypothetical protein